MRRALAPRSLDFAPLTREHRHGLRCKPAGRVLFAIALFALACASEVERSRSSESRLIDLSCSRFNPVMQTAILEAVVAGGGPGSVDVAGWMCGRLPFGYVRVVMLRYTPDDPRQPPFLVPAVFEDGGLVAFGWHLFEAEPYRYGTSPLPDRVTPWRMPEGWSRLRQGRINANEIEQ